MSYISPNTSTCPSSCTSTTRTSAWKTPYKQSPFIYANVLRALSQLGRLILAAFLLVTTSLHAGDADVVDVQIKELGENRFHIDVTLKHGDEGWDHFANRWDVLAGATENLGELLGSRVLAHPHVNEQPFTRSLSLTIPAGITHVTIRANDSVHEAQGVTMTVAVPGR